MYRDEASLPKLRCPNHGCGARLMDASTAMMKNAIAVYVCEPGYIADFTLFCPKCRRRIGITLNVAVPIITASR